MELGPHAGRIPAVSFSIEDATLIRQRLQKLLYLLGQINKQIPTCFHDLPVSYLGVCMILYDALEIQVPASVTIRYVPGATFSKYSRH